jgi:prevent-host-death family protein
MAERTISATEARVHFGELLDSVVHNLDIVYVQRAGRPQVVIVSIDEWNRHKHKDDPWAGVEEMMEEHEVFLRAERAAGRLKDFDPVELIRAGREERDEQIVEAVFGREPDDQLRS